MKRSIGRTPAIGWRDSCVDETDDKLDEVIRNV